MNLLDRILLVAILCCTTVLSSTAQDMFTRVFGGNSYDIGKGVIQLDDDGYMLLSSTGSFGFETGHVMLTRLNHKGDYLWNRYFGGDFAHVAESFVRTVDGGFVVTGFAETLDSSYNVLVFRTDEEGELIWMHRYGSIGWDIGKKVVALDDGGFAVAGVTHGNSEDGQADAFLYRLGADGTLLWSAFYGGEMGDGAESLAITDSGFVLGGYTESAGNGGTDAWIVRVDNDGLVLWEATFGEEEDDIARALVFTQDGGIAFAGSTGSGGYGGLDFYLLKMDGQGNHVWTFISSSSGPNDDEWLDLIEDPNGSLTMCGYGDNPNFGGGNGDAFMGRISSGGWFDGLSGTYGEGGREVGHGLIRTSEGGYALIGETTGYFERMTDVVMFKVNESGFGVGLTLDVQEIEQDGVSFSAVVAPNPSQGIATLHLEGYDRWASSLSAPMILEVTDLLGRPVFNIPVIGSQTLIDLSDRPEGLYAYRVYSGARMVIAGRLVRAGH
jgi:hypothetical protein